jgi:SH3-like domain-containing protein
MCVCVCVCVLSKQQLTTDEIYYSTEKTNPSSYRRGGPLPNYLGVKYENKNMVTGPDGALHQE